MDENTNDEQNNMPAADEGTATDAPAEGGDMGGDAPAADDAAPAEGGDAAAE